MSLDSTHSTGYVARGDLTIDEILSQLEGHLEADSQEYRRELNKFQDGDLKMFPAAEIVELNLSGCECETIANNIMQALARADQRTINKPARALVALAHNSLMDPYYARRQLSRWDDPKPLFHTDRYKFHEDWLRVIAKSDLNLRDFLTQPNEESGDETMKLRLICSRATDFERKASIGAWAFFHLRLMGNLRYALWTTNSIQHFARTFKQQYGFDVVYEFPQLDKTSHHLLKGHFMNTRPGELWYLFYRSIIALENMPRQYWIQRQLIKELAFRDGLIGECGLWLWTWARSAAQALAIPVEDLFDQLQIALEDPVWSKYTNRSRKSLNNLRSFHEIYIKPEGAEGRSRYYKYARVVNHWYFNSLCSSGNIELVAALVHIYERARGGTMKRRPIFEPWTSWGNLIGRKVFANYAHTAHQSEAQQTDFDNPCDIL